MGGGVAERPALKPSLTPTKSGDRSRSSPYRVLLHNDDTNKREYVVSVLMKVVDGLGVDEAVNVMNVREEGREGREGGRRLSPPSVHLSRSILSLSPLYLSQEAHQNGKAAVIVCGQPDAEKYCEGLRSNGLIASIEPASGG